MQAASDELPSSVGLIASGDPNGSGNSTVQFVREIKIGAGLIRVLISGESSDRRLELFEFRVPPHEPGPPLHTHQGSEECFTLLEGSAEFRVGSETFVAVAGQSLVVPRRVPHAWRVIGDVALRMLVTFTPAIEMERYFAELADLFGTHKAMPNAELLAALWTRYDTRPA